MLSRVYDKIKLLRILLFVITSIIISLFFSKERKFRYEFRKGYPWQYDNLYAPYDFSILKLQDEIQHEADSITSNVNLFFNFEPTIENIVIEQFSSEYESNLDNYLKNLGNKQKYIKKDIFKQFENDFIINLKFIYEKGIYTPSDILDFKLSPPYKIAFKKDNFVKIYLNDQIFTTETANEYLNYVLSKYYSSENYTYFLDFIKSFTTINYVMKNLFFDRQKTENIINQTLKNISKTRGYKKAGELIIAKGEIVNNDKYRILKSFKSIYENTKSTYSRFLIYIGDLFLTALILFIFIYFIKNNYEKEYNKLSSLLLIFSLILFFTALFKFSFYLKTVNIYILPLAILPLTIKIFFDERLAFFSLLIAIIFIGFIVPSSFDFLIIEFFSGIASVLVISRLNRREQFYYAAAIVFVTMSTIYLTINIIQEGSFESIHSRNFGYFVINGILVMLSYPFVYAIEKIFGIISDITLLELSNTNHPLLQRLASSAPGTFQHSIEVASLAEAAAIEIGANPLLTKVGALYHDVGKSIAPAFFTENQISGYNPHDQIDYQHSARIIIDHINKGVILAKRFKLPEQIIDFIRTHHGTSTAQYFYIHFIKKYPDRTDEIDKFTYPGPKPFSKETAIVMMSDAIEASAKSLKEYNAENIAEIVENVFNHQMENKQYEDANLTFAEIKKIKKMFKQRLLNVYHSRIEYPK